MGNLWGDDYSDLYPPRRTWGQWLAGFFFATGGPVTTAKYDLRHEVVDRFATQSGHTFPDKKRAAAMAFAEDLSLYTGCIDLTSIHAMNRIPMIGGNAHRIRKACDLYLNTVADLPPGDM